MDMEGSRWVEATLEDTATREATMITIARVEWTTVIMAAAVDQSAWMAWEGAGACRCSWKKLFECWVVSILLRPSGFCSLWRWLWEESDSLLVHLYFEPWNPYYISCNSWVEGSAVELKSWRLSSNPLVMLVNILQIYRSETVERRPHMAQGAASQLFFIMRKELCWKWFFFFKLEMFLFFCLAASQGAYFNFHYCRCHNPLCWFVFNFSWLINIHQCIVSALCKCFVFFV